jgi:DNA-binding XRE family transcriptional regulator
MSVQFIEKNGKPEWAVISYADYINLVETAEIAKDIREFRLAQAKGEEELLPAEFANRLIDGENPIRVWREYRKMTQGQLAEKAKLSVPYLSQLEHGERVGGASVLKRIAEVLRISLDDIV